MVTANSMPRVAHGAGTRQPVQGQAPPQERRRVPSPLAPLAPRRRRGKATVRPCAVPSLHPNISRPSCALAKVGFPCKPRLSVLPLLSRLSRLSLRPRLSVLPLLFLLFLRLSLPAPSPSNVVPCVRGLAGRVYTPALPPMPAQPSCRHWAGEPGGLCLSFHGAAA